MEEKVVGWDKAVGGGEAVDRDRGKAEAAGVVPVREGLSISACVRNVDIVSRMNGECHAFSNNVQNAGRRWSENKKKEH